MCIRDRSWTAGDNTETGYDVQRKNSSDGNFASIGTPTAESYEDSTIAKGNSYWYRVLQQMQMELVLDQM